MTLRFLILLVVCVAITLLSLTESGTTVLAKTGHELDLAIAGRGYFCVMDDAIAEVRYTKSGSLCIDANSQLAIEMDGNRWCLEPPVLIPDDWRRIAVRSNGLIQTHVSGSWMDAGQIQLAVFSPSPAFDDSLAANRYSYSVGTETRHAPGDVAGLVVQGWLEECPSTVDQLSIRILLAILAAAVLSRCTLASDVTRALRGWHTMKVRC